MHGICKSTNGYVRIELLHCGHSNLKEKGGRYDGTGNKVNYDWRITSD